MLVKEAHTQGFKLIIDWVANHSSPDNVWLKEVNTENCSNLLLEIETNRIEKSSHYLFKMGDNFIKSDSIPTKYRKLKI